MHPIDPGGVVGVELTKLGAVGRVPDPHHRITTTKGPVAVVASQEPSGAIDTCPTPSVWPVSD
ncbi:hypothetical protein [Phytohabitans aurantiacus]|uniref:Uncharacterized protein n=1 Tax=Phytohabitans aurantiacus TaxID=3016789 RepID=A0ABQ5R2X9_9ACTN|nr:hypothetical protein [Phytohabitans aurantiacus]GLI00588.1 hypothetical protein Pa4123_58640 [Phytohabitans aurantiacus]